MKKKYIIIYEHSYTKLEDRVAAAMQNGYTPHGSMVFRPEYFMRGNKTYIKECAFIQPMVLKK